MHKRIVVPIPKPIPIIAKNITQHPELVPPLPEPVPQRPPPLFAGGDIIIINVLIVSNKI